MKRFLQSVFTLSVIVCSSIHTHGFVGDTLVHTESGMRTIKNIYETYSPYELAIYGCDETTFAPFTQRMIKAAEGECEHTIRIMLEGAFPIECAPYQCFYVVGKRKQGYAVKGTPECDAHNCIDWLISDTKLGATYAGKRIAPECAIGVWTRACDVKVDDYLFCKNNWHRWVSSVELIKSKTTMYTLEIENTHTYFVGDAQVLAHNFPLLAAGAALSWGETAYFGTAALAAMWAAAQATTEFFISDQVIYYPAGTNIITNAGLNAAEASLSTTLKKAAPVITGIALTGYFTYHCIQEIQRVYYGVHYNLPYVTGAVKGSTVSASAADVTISPLMNAINAGHCYYSQLSVTPETLFQEREPHKQNPDQSKQEESKKQKGSGGGPDKEPDDDNSILKAAGAAAGTAAQNEEVEKKVVELGQNVKGAVVDAAEVGVEKIRTMADFAKNSLTHIFKKKIGHYEKETEKLKQLLLDVASDMKNYLGTSIQGPLDWFHKINEKGEQIWVCGRNRLIENGGINQTPRSYDPVTGLYRNLEVLGKIWTKKK